MGSIRHKIICAIDTGDLGEAVAITQRLAPHVGAFKIGHALTLPNGLGVLEDLKRAGAERVFLDLKFHDIPSVVALGVREAAKRGVWMLTMHISGGPAMINAAVEEANAFDSPPLLVGVSVLTSLDERHVREHLGVPRSVLDHMTSLSQTGVDCGLDGVVCSVHEIEAVRQVVGHACIVTPGIRAVSGEVDDHHRAGTGDDAIRRGADYLVIGRALTASDDPVRALAALGLG